VRAGDREASAAGGRNGVGKRLHLGTFIRVDVFSLIADIHSLVHVCMAGNVQNGRTACFVIIIFLMESIEKIMSLCGGRAFYGNNAFLLYGSGCASERENCTDPKSLSCCCKNNNSLMCARRAPARVRRAWTL
jgi:hypothetical protein